MELVKMRGFICRRRYFLPNMTGVLFMKRGKFRHRDITRRKQQTDAPIS